MQAESRPEQDLYQREVQYSELARSNPAFGQSQPDDGSQEHEPLRASQQQPSREQPSFTSAGRSSQAPLNIDDLPVPARSNAAQGKTFEELLEENLAQDPTA